MSGIAYLDIHSKHMKIWTYLKPAQNPPFNCPRFIVQIKVNLNGFDIRRTPTSVDALSRNNQINQRNPGWILQLEDSRHSPPYVKLSEYKGAWKWDLGAVWQGSPGNLREMAAEAKTELLKIQQETETLCRTWLVFTGEGLLLTTFMMSGDYGTHTATHTHRRS